MIYSKIAVLGAGTIGMSWAALFAATGRDVVIFDPAPDVEARGTALIEQAAPTLRELGWDHAGDMSRIRFTDDPVEAVTGADFVQESVPERLEIKHDLYAKIEPHLGRGVLIGTSTSGLTLTALQEGLKDPGGLLLAHPFNPPHLIPLVELMDNAQTRKGALAEAQAFYESIGKSCIRLNKEVPGHVANRLQAAVWREAIHLAMEGVASVKDIDTAISHGPGLRWAAMGPTTTFHLGGGAGGIRAFCDHLTGPFESWWADLGAPHLTPEVVEVLAKGLEDATAGQEMQDLVQRRDDLVLTYVKAAMARDNG